jgi:Fe-S cluster assembly scaffold protein SufB
MSHPEGARVAAAAVKPAPTRATPSRQAPDELTMSFVDEATVRSISRAAKDPAWLLADRLAGLRAFEALPVESNSLYTTYVDLRNAHLGAATPYLPGAAPAQAACQPELPEGAAAYAEYCEDAVAGIVVSPEAAAAGVIVEPLAQLASRDPKLLRELLEGGCTLPENDKLAHMTRALWTHGLFVRVPDGVHLEQPIVLRWTMGAPDRALLARTIVSIGTNAEASILEEQLDGGSAASPDSGQALFAGTTEVKLGDDSTLAFAGLQDFGLRQIVFQHRSAELGRGSNLRWALAQLGCRVVRSRIDNFLPADNAAVEQVEIVFGSTDQLFDLTSYTRHTGRDTTGNLLSKGVLAERSRVYMKGLATIDLPAHGTDSFVGEFGLLLSRQARSVAIPSLEIDQPDCRRVAHSSSVGPIDESQLFYLESRGIDPDEARKFIVLGFLEPVVARVPLASAQDRLRDLLEARWAAMSATPAGVAA